MNWYGTIGVSVEGRARDLRKLSRMARVYVETMRQDGEPPDCVYEAEYFAWQIENAVISLGRKFVAQASCFSYGVSGAVAGFH